MINLNDLNNQNWHNIRISIIGAGISGIAAANLSKNIGAIPFISDSNDFTELRNKVANYNSELGGHTEEVLDSELLIISPGIPDTIDIIGKSKAIGIPVVSEIEFASWFTESPIIAVTGSNGKSTTVNLLYQIF